MVALVDDEDYDELIKYKWHAVFTGRKWYASRRIMMHNVIMKADDGQIIDHQNGNGLDCQRHNLRKATHSQNAANRASINVTGYRGVQPDSTGMRFRAYISKDRKRR